jgi:hypothetical protein
MEPRNRSIRGSRRLVRDGRPRRGAAMAWRTRSRRGLRTGHAHARVPQEPGRPRHLLGKSRAELPGDQLQARGRRIRRPRERNTGAAGVPPSEGNEARREGWRGVGAPRMYRRRGGTDPRDPAEGRGRRAMRPPEGEMPGTPSPVTISTGRRRIAMQGRGREVAGEFVARRAVCLNWACTDLWGAEVGNRPGLPDTSIP